MPADPADRGGVGHWLGDLSANLLCVVLVVLMLIALSPLRQGAERPEIVLPVHVDAPLSGPDMVDMLYARARGTSGAALDLLAEGVRASEDVAAADAVALPGGAADVFVFDHRHHAALRARLEGAGVAVRELSVPAALRTRDGADWSPAFLALGQGAPDRDRFARALTDLLVGGVAAGGAMVDEVTEPERPGTSLIARLRAWQTTTNAGLALVFGLLIWAIARRGRRYSPMR